MQPISLPPSLKKLIRQLNDLEFHSGTDIGNELGLTRSGVWKLVKQLNSLGIYPESVTNKGYRLLNELELLDKAKIKKQINKDHLRLMGNFLVADQLPSTNDYLIHQARNERGKNAVCLAEQQTAGRGRLGRHWVSPFACNLYLSLLWHFNCDISQLPGLNSVAGIAVTEAIRNMMPLSHLHLKWPNDIFWHDKKLGGILIDVIGEYNGRCAAVIGIGLNVAMPPASGSQIQKPWTDLRTASNRIVSRNQLAGSILNSLITYLMIFEERGVGEFLAHWQNQDYLLGKRVAVKTITKSISGVAQGINDHGHLLLRNDHGELVAIAAGDASVADN